MNCGPLLLAFFWATIALAQPPPSMNIDRASVTVSGFSGGGKFAPQFHLAYSANVSGCATWSGGPPLCAAEPNCYEHEYDLVDVSLLVRETVRLMRQGDVDDVANLADDRFHK